MARRVCLPGGQGQRNSRQTKCWPRRPYILAGQFEGDGGIPLKEHGLKSPKLHEHVTLSFRMRIWGLQTAVRARLFRCRSPACCQLSKRRSAGGRGEKHVYIYIYIYIYIYTSLCLSPSLSLYII